MARGKRPVSFRTRKLSLSAPMVLPWRRGGRVGRRRTTIPERAPATRLGPFLHVTRVACPPPFLRRSPAGKAHSAEPPRSRSAATDLLRGRADVVRQPG